MDDLSISSQFVYFARIFHIRNAHFIDYAWKKVFFFRKKLLFSFIHFKVASTAKSRRLLRLWSNGDKNACSIARGNKKIDTIFTKRKWAQNYIRGTIFKCNTLITTKYTQTHTHSTFSADSMPTKVLNACICDLGPFYGDLLFFGRVYLVWMRSSSLNTTKPTPSTKIQVENSISMEKHENIAWNPSFRCRRTVINFYIYIIFVFRLCVSVNFCRRFGFISVIAHFPIIFHVCNNSQSYVQY